MFGSRIRLPSTLAACGLALFLLQIVTRAATASGPPYGIPSGVMPWEYYKYYKGYTEPSRGSGSRPAPPATVSQAPLRYTIQIAFVPVRHNAEDANVAVVMGHVPEDASIWFEDDPTRQKGAVRYFESPSLKPGGSYFYSVRVVWYEDGQWVTQTVRVPVRAGEIRCFYLVGSDQAKELAAVTASLEKLSPEDQRRASLQRVCAVQPDTPLGSMGVPVKVTLKGEAVFLCCDGCVKKAVGSPDQTLERLRKAKADKGHGSPR